MVRATLLANQLHDPVWKISGLIDNELRADLLKVFQAIPSSDFKKAETGSKLSLENRSELGEALFNSSAAQKLAQLTTSIAFIDLLSSLFNQSNSNYLQIPILQKPAKIRPATLSHFIPDKYLDCSLNPAWFSTLNNRNQSKVHESLQNLILAYNSVPFIPTMQFSIINQGGFIPPHTDVSNKLATLLIYLPSNKTQEETPLGTTWWRPKSNAILGQQESHFITGNQNIKIFKDNYEKVRTPFQNEDILLFFRSDTSWHSFEYDIPDVGSRYSININMTAP